jgi:hypothetical protein
MKTLVRVVSGAVAMAALVGVMQAHQAQADPPLCTGSETVTVSAPIIVHDGETLDMTGCTVVPAAGYVGNLLRNEHSASTTDVDRDITVIGGTWNRGSGLGGGLDRHTLVFRHLEGLTVRDVTVTSTGGKYALSLGAVRRVTVENFTCQCASDGVHVAGPADSVDITNVQGTTGDDMVALTARDWPAYADTVGDITNVRVNGVFPTGSLAALKIISGTGTVVRGVQVHDIVGSTRIRPVAIMDDTTGPTVADGVVIDGMDVAQSDPAYGVVWLRGVASTDITFRDVRQRSTQTATPLVLVDRTTNIRAFTIDGWVVQPGANPLVGVYGSAVLGTTYLTRIGGTGWTGAALKVGSATAKAPTVKRF